MQRMIQLADRTAFKERMKQCLTIDANKTVVMTVDMQRQYLDMDVGGQPVLPEEAQRVLKYSKELLDFAREQGIPVLHVYVCRRQREIETDLSGTSFYRASRDLKLSQLPDTPEKPVPDRLEGSPQCQVPEELVAESDLHVRSKKTMDSYLGTEIELLFQRVLKPETVVLMGINTDTCVYSTTFSTANRGYKTIVISDCTASMRGKDSHEMALELMSRSFSWVLTVAEFKEKVL
ncbi:cysteine hydrolase [Chloroflexota bacterium]